MSYQVIARKWRPQTFDEVTGQSHVTTPLRNAIRSDRIPHALLFTGPRGVGKTTLARILARCLNCEKGPTDEPCGSCAACLEITSGRSTDVQEIDAASRTGVDDMREVIESIRYAPSPGKHRIFVVDEVHMLSTAAFNALLKTLEEPPPRSLFVFATTNPEKIPFTVLSRCQRYDLRRISAAEVARCLGDIAQAEGISISQPSLLALAREGEGSMRDSQTLLDQVISYGGSEVADETVSQVLDLIDRRLLVSILGACIDSNPTAVLEACAHVIEKGSDPKRLGADLIKLLRDLVVLSIADGGELVEGSEEEIAELRELARRCEPARLRRMFRVLVKEQEDLAWAPQPASVLEMALVRLATLPSGEDVAQLIARLEALERQIAAGGGNLGGGSGGGGNARATGGSGRAAPGGAGGGGGAAKKLASEPSEATPASAASAPSAAPSPQPTRPAPSAPASAPASASASQRSPAPTPEPAPALATVSEIEEEIVAVEEAPASDGLATPGAVMDRLRGLAKEGHPGLHHSLLEATLVARSEGALTIAASNAFYQTRLKDRAEELRSLCARFFGRPMKVEVALAEGASAAHPDHRRSDKPTPMSRAEAREAERLLKHAALNHPAINQVLREMQGEIIEIRPLGAGAGESR